jgi:2-polyprenyl-6-methoxyphenol hydroxylase-like FAD-dependent oxidoreductase
MQNTPEILIAGGGIGGLALALSLHHNGIREIEVYESVPEVRELGVGINLLPHAVRELTELGLLPALEAVAIPTAELAFYNERGQYIWSEPRGLAAGYKWPQFSIHRGDLLMLLYRAVIERLGPARYHAGHHLSRFTETPEGRVRAEFIDRVSGQTILSNKEADILVGADGVHSVVRRAFYPNEGPPKWNGITMWRAVTVGKPFLSGRTMFMAGHFNQRVVVYPISKKLEDRGDALINWVAEYRTEEGRPMPPQDWNHHGQAADVLKHFGDFVFDWLDMTEVFRKAESIYQYPMVDRDPVPRWSFGPVTLLGDAAHPMYPVGSNGASQGIIDARVLARALALGGNAKNALEAYEEERRPVTARVVLLNREVGAEQCMEIVHERAPQGFERIEDVISQLELEEIAQRYKQTAGFDRDTLNNRPSLSVFQAGPC